MTRKEHLEFCKRCTKRSFDPKLGVTCSLTNEIADFEDECANFQLDETVKEEAIVEDDSPIEIVQLTDEIKEEFRVHQVLTYAIIGGFFLSVICALLWALVTVTTEYQIGYMALAVGLIVGMGVRYFGAGIDPVYRFVGAFFSLLGCALGNLFSQVGFIADAESLGYFETLTYLDLETIILIYKESFSPMDVLFYGFAIYEGFRFAVRPIPANYHKLTDFTPAYSNLRFPLVIVCFLIISVAGYSLSRGVSGQTNYYYESGNTMSSGELKESQLHGPWVYYYENGSIQLTGSYDMGYETGEWIWYNAGGTIVRKGNYNKGLADGTWLNYYDNGELYNSADYSNGRLSGTSVSYYDNGQISQKGNFLRDKQDGNWIYFNYDGQKNMEGNYKTGSPFGRWKFWNADNIEIEELEFDEDNNYKIINTRNPEGELIVIDGNGEYRNYYDDGNLSEVGQVVDGEKIGIWRTYYTNGQLKEEFTNENNLIKIINTWSLEGDPQVIDGNGKYTQYYGESTTLFEAGTIKDGFKDGFWEVYYNEPHSIQEESTYIAGKLNGEIITYYLDGSVSTQGYYKDDMRDGNWVWYYENGEQESSITYQLDKKQGTQLFWSENGLPTKEEIYENGELINEVLY